MSAVATFDPEIAQVIENEKRRQRDQLVMIASENYTSAAVLEATGSILTNKYAEGYPGRRYYAGCENVDVSEQLAIDRAKELFGAEAANVQPHSGSQANMAAFFALANPGDKIMAMSLDKVSSRLDKMAPQLCPFEILEIGSKPRFRFLRQLRSI